MIKRTAILCFCAVLATAAAIAEVPFQPFPDAPITLEQWTAYHAKVRDVLGSSAQERTSEMAMLYFDEKTRTQYIFTLPTHPAHPAWITRRLVSRSGAVTVEQIGYFAGSEQQFASWFAAFQRANEQMKQQR